MFCKRSFLVKSITLCVMSAALLISFPLQAGAKTPATDPAKTKREAEKAKAEEQKVAVNNAVAAHLTYLKPYLPRLTAADIKGTSLVNLRRLYYEAYRAQGLGMDEATSKAAAEITVEKAAEITLNNGDVKKAKMPGKEAIARLESLSSYFPNLTLPDIESLNDEDLRKLYYEAYRNQGMTMLDAKKMANQLDMGPAEIKKPAPAETSMVPAVVDTNFDYLKPFLPWLKPEDMKGKSDADLKRLYYEAYRAQGMTVQEAAQTAERLVVVKLSIEDDPYSLAPGQIASSTKTSVSKKPDSTPQKKK